MMYIFTTLIKTLCLMYCSNAYLFRDGGKRISALSMKLSNEGKVSLTGCNTSDAIR